MANPQFLRYLVALTEHGHFSRAARSLGITQPALTLGIKKLEQELGVRLFDRARGSVTLTAFGSATLLHAQRLLEGNAKLRHEIDMLKGMQAGDLVVAAGTFAADISGHAAMGRLSQRFPAIRCRIMLREWKECVSVVLEGGADLALAEISAAEHEPRLVTELIGTHRGQFFCRTGHPLARRKKVAVRDVIAYPWALVTLPSRMAVALATANLRAGSFDRRREEFIPSIRVDTLAGAQEVVRKSDAISAAPLGMIREDIRRRRLALIRCYPPWLRLNYGFIYPRDRTLSPAARAFIEEVRGVESQLDW